MPRTRENMVYAQRLIKEYNYARKLLRKYLKKPRDPSDVTAMIKAVILSMTAKQSKIIGYTLNSAFKAGAKEGDRIVRKAHITASAATVGFDMTKVADTHLNKITGDTIGSVGKYNSVTTNQLFGQYQTLLADNTLVNRLGKSGWSPSIEKSLVKRGIAPEVISQLKGQTTTKKIVSILETQGIRGGMNPRQISRLMQPTISAYFGPKGVIIDNVGKFKKVLKVDADGNYKYMKQAVTRPYRATPKTYSNLLARSSMLQAHHEGRYQSLKKTGLVDHYISVSVLDANTCNLCATMHGQRVSHSDGPLYHPSCACDLKPVYKKGSGLEHKNKDLSVYDKQRDQHFWKQHQLAEYNKNMPKGAKLKFHSMLPKDALVDMPGKEAMRTIRYNALGKPAVITPKVSITKPKVAPKVVPTKPTIPKPTPSTITPKPKVPTQKPTVTKPKATTVKPKESGKPQIIKEKKVTVKIDQDGITKELKPQGINYIGDKSNVLKLTKAEEAAADAYQGSGFININNGLRGKTKLTSKLKTRIKNIDGALQKSVIKKDVNVYRGISEKQANIIMKTNQCMNEGYTSTTYNAKNAFTFANKDAGGFTNMMEFKVKGGTKALTWPGGENEIMMRRGLKMKCTGIRETSSYAVKSGSQKALQYKKVRTFIMEVVD